ncbi:MAG: hypothetical protein WKG06_20300 [Segetibacter sp.]
MIDSLKNSIYRNSLAFMLLTIAVAGFTVKGWSQSEIRQRRRLFQNYESTGS